MESQTIVIIGGTGFLGRYVVRLLAKTGCRLRVITRRPDEGLHLKTAGDVGQIVLSSGDLTRPESLAGQIEGAFAVINLVGILYESGRQTFTALHAQGAEKLAKLAKDAGVGRFVHVSSLGVDRAVGSHYARSKALGERAVLAAFPEATVLRPSVMFGPEDNFFNQFADMAAKFPALPLIGGGTQFQPVYVGDVAKAIKACLLRDDVFGQVYELGGPRVLSFRDIMEYIMRETGHVRRLVPVPFSMASLMGKVSELLPRPPLTADQVTLLKYDNTVSPTAKGFAQLKLQPTALEVIVPEYLVRFRKGLRNAA